MLDEYLVIDGCPSNSTIIPSQSGDTSLDMSVHWPETNIGVEAIVDCPCGDNDTSSGTELKAFRYCGGDFTNGALWTTIDVAQCNFSDLARKICNLRNVRQIITRLYNTKLHITSQQLPVDEKVQQLEELTSNTQELKTTEVTASVSILVTATEDVSGNITVINMIIILITKYITFTADNNIFGSGGQHFSGQSGGSRRKSKIIKHISKVSSHHK